MSAADGCYVVAQCDQSATSPPDCPLGRTLEYRNDLAYMIYHGRDSGILNLEYLRERGTILWGNVGKRNDWKDQKRISQNYVSAEIQHEIGHSVGIHMVRGLYFKILLLRYDRIQTFYRPEVHQFRVFKQKPNS